jgi:uncharacterized protein (TIGR03435 family)
MCKKSRLCAAVFLSSALWLPLHAQQPTFDVASIRQNKTANPTQVDLRGTPTSLTVVNLPLRTLIGQAYQLPDYAIIGGPEWLRTDRWDIIAKSNVPGNDDLTRSRLKSLLAERFQFVTRVEKRDLPGYALTRLRDDGALGDRLRPSSVNCAVPAAPVPRGEPPCGVSTTWVPAGLTLRGRQSFSTFLIVLGQYVGRPFLDKTGLSGPYAYDLTFAPDSTLRADVPAAEAPSLSTAMRDQLGLKLESMTVPTDVLVIESVARPSEN